MLSPIDGQGSASYAKPTRRSCALPWRRPQPAFQPGPRRQSSERAADARTRRRPARSSIAARCSRCCRTRPARRLTTRSPNCARPPTICRYYAAQARSALGAAADAGADRREQRAALSRPRRVRLHQPVEFPARDLSRPDQRRRSPPATRSSPSPPSRRRSSPRAAVALLHEAGVPASRAASRARRRRRRRQPGRRSARRRRCVHRLDRSRPRHQPRARRQGRADRAADRRNRRHQRHDRRRHRVARAGHRRRDRRRRSAPPASAARRCGCSACRRTSPTACSTCSIGAARELKVGDPRDPATHVGPVIDAEAKAEARRAGSPSMERAGRVRFRCDRRRKLPAGGTYVRADHHRARPRRAISQEEVFGPVLHVVRWRADGAGRAARRHRRQRHGAHARHPFAHRRDRRRVSPRGSDTATSTSTAT